jgi:hypothetical protein
MSVSEGASSSVLPAGVTVVSIRQLYSPGEVALATVFGGPLGGAWLLARNYQRLDARRKARAALAIGALAMAAVVAIGFLIPPTAVVLILLFPPIVAIALAERLQGADYVRRAVVGGRTRSSWRALGVGVALIPIYLAPILGGAIVHLADTTRVADIASGPGMVMVGINRVYYTPGVVREEAQRVGRGLIELVPERADAGWAIEVTRDGDRPVVGFIFADSASLDPEVGLAFHQLAEGLSRAAYGGAPIDVWLVDPRLRPRLKLRWESRPR